MLASDVLTTEGYPSSTKMTHPHILFGNPLARIDRVYDTVRPAPSPDRLREMEDGFILDCIITDKLRYKWSADIIPKYDARFDPYAAHYFKSPAVNLLLRKTIINDMKPRHCTSTPIKPYPFHRPKLQTLTLSGRKRLPPEKTREELAERRGSFINNSVFITNQVTKRKPLIEPYDALYDKHSEKYFRKSAVKKLLTQTVTFPRPRGIHPMVCKDKGGTSIDGPVIDRFIESGSGYRYLHARNEAPRAAKAGHSQDQVDGHGQFMSDAKPNFGYHGQFGYRRNTPWLRNMPSPFGVDPRSPLH
ncbi:uncharacterized protein [Apostichopus japonicus]|uniref:uncharacterized protein isoform X1 n=1 Tax=Stichopus japonicus TaxID=307972 RepID=UPI003AB164C6